MTILTDNLEYDSDVYGCCNVFEKSKVAFECTPGNRDKMVDEHQIDGGLDVYYKSENCKNFIYCHINGVK